MPEEFCRTNLISDEPAEQDSFRGASQRVATAIAEVIRTEDGGKTIGLEGGWGTGKLTIVNLVIKELSQFSDIKVWIFDAWAHQGDPLRRTFLEGLITWLQQVQPEGWLKDQDYWDIVRLKLAGRLKNSKSTTAQIPSGLARWFALALVLLPIGAGLLAASLGQPFWNPAFEWTIESTLVFWVGIGLLIPTLAIVGFAIIQWMNKGKAAQGGFSLFTQSTSTESESFESPDPTSVEFEEKFSELMGSALGGNARRLVLCVDNLDRIEASDAFAIWSTMQTFIEHRVGGGAEWLSRLWIIPPYDRKAMESIFPKTDEGASSTFLDKRIQVRFDVPPPVLTDWRRYLIDMLTMAFPDHHDPEVFAKIYQVYRSDQRGASSRPTPRALKLFVNGIGALHRQWKDTFSLPEMAYYESLRSTSRSNLEIAAQIVEGKIPSRQTGHLFGSSLQDVISALLYGVPVVDARELILRDPIDNALKEPDGTQLNQLMQSANSFWEVFEQTDFSQFLQADLLRATRVLVSFDLVGYRGDRPTEVQSILGWLRIAFHAVEAWDEFGATTADGITGFLELFPDVDQVRSMIDKMSARTIERSLLGSWVGSVVSILRKADELELQDGYASGFQIPVAIHDLFEGCLRLTEEDEASDYWSYVGVEAEREAVATELVNIVQNEETAGRVLATVKVFGKSGVQLDWTSAVDAIRAKLQQDSTPEDSYSQEMLRSLWSLRELAMETSDQALNTFAESGFALHHVWAFREASDAHMTALSMYVYLRSFPESEHTSEVGQAVAGHEFLNQVLQNPNEYQPIVEAYASLINSEMNMQHLFDLADRNPNSIVFVQRCVENLGPDAPVLRSLSPQLMIERWSVLELGLDARIQVLLTRQIEEESLLQQIIEAGFERSQSGLYSLALEAGGARAEPYIGWLQDGLGHVDAAVWLNEMDRRNEEWTLADVAITLSGTGVSLSPSDAYVAALLERTQRYWSSGIDQEDIPTVKLDWHELTQPLDNASRKRLRLKIFDELVQNRSSIASGYFPVMSDEFSFIEILAAGSQTYTLFEDLIERGHLEGLSWLVSFLESHPTFPSNRRLRDPARLFGEFLARHAETTLENQPAEVQEAVRSIASVFGVDVSGG